MDTVSFSSSSQELKLNQSLCNQQTIELNLKMDQAQLELFDLHKIDMAFLSSVPAQK